MFTSKRTFDLTSCQSMEYFQNLTMKPKTFIENFHDESSVDQMSYQQLGHTDMVVSKLSLGMSDITCLFYLHCFSTG